MKRRTIFYFLPHSMGDWRTLLNYWNTSAAIGEVGDSSLLSSSADYSIAWPIQSGTRSKTLFSHLQPDSSSSLPRNTFNEAERGSGLDHAAQRQASSGKQLPQFSLRAEPPVKDR